MFNGVEIRVGFQLELELTFGYTAVNVKPGFMKVFIFVAKGLLPKTNFVVTPTHYWSRSANPFAPKCPIKSATHRFPRLDVRAS